MQTANGGGDAPKYLIEEAPNVWRAITNPREEAILDVLGGRAQARVKLKMTRQGVHQILTVARVKDVESAERIAKATADAGREVPAVELLGLAPWRGPERHDNDPRRGTRKRDDRHLTLVESATDDADETDEPEAPAEPTLVPVPGLTASARVGTYSRPARRNLALGLPPRSSGSKTQAPTERTFSLPSEREWKRAAGWR